MGPDDLTEDGFFRTGDCGFVDKDGCLYITDRIKDLLISGGVNIYPAEIEEVLVTHSAVMEAAVIGIPNSEFGEELMAYCELRPGPKLDPVELAAYCREWLTPHKVPKTFHFGELPRNASGKVLKKDIRRPFWKGRNRRV
jgi:long-chain acyl-CoA synthetase